MLTIDLHAARAAVSAEKARRSLHEFVRQYWSVIDSATFCDSWHIRAICEHLEAVTRGQINNLLINIPPGCAKSLLVSVFWPAWEWATNPTHKYFGASYGADLAIRDALKCKDIITSAQYRSAYPKTELRRDAQGKEEYHLTAGGWRIATGVKGRGTGLHPTRKIIDDPHTVDQAESDAERINAVTWFNTTLPSRGLGLGASTVVVMQRLHQKDISGTIMDSADYGNWEHLLLPMEYEPGRGKVSVLGFKDPRQEEGELLWPQLFDHKKVEMLKVKLGSYGTAGQLQQRPSPEGGGVLDIRCFKLWPNGVPWPDFRYIVQSYDTAYTDRTQNDPTACTIWGVFDRRTQEGIRPAAMLLDCWSEFMQYPQLRQKVLDDWMAKYGGIDGDPMHPPRRADAALIEEKGSGQSLIQDLRQANVPVIAYNPGRADKSARAQIAAPLLEAGMFYIPESGRREDAGKARVWARPMLEQLEHFPNGEHDDYVDTFTQAAIFLRDKGFLELKAIDNEVPVELDYHERSKARVNPYAQ